MLHRSFEVDCNPQTTSLTLVEAKSIGRPGDSEDRPPFSLVFHSGLEILLVAGSYTMRCGNFGPDIIYIAPIMPMRGATAGHYYEAVFN